MNRVIVAVTNDLSSDQRVRKVCDFLVGNGMDVTLIGRRLKDSLPIERPYRCVRMRLLFNTGPLFYAEYNLRLFLQILWRRPNVVVSNDLDSLPACSISSSLSAADMVYDSHEYFTEVPELVSRPMVQRMWLVLERLGMTSVNRMSSVNRSIAGFYKRKYGKDVRVIRNMPVLDDRKETLSRTDLGLPTDQRVILLQGAWINMDRGGEEAVLSMKEIDGAILLICGGGDAIDRLQQMTAEASLQDKVIFKPRMPYEQLRNYTAVADIGLTLDKDTNANYRYSLPNKLFDYIHAGVPVVASDLVEVARIINDHQVGQVVSEVTPSAIAAVVNDLLGDNDRLDNMKANCLNVRADLSWQNEEAELSRLYAGLLSRHNR